MKTQVQKCIKCYYHSRHCGLDPQSPDQKGNTFDSGDGGCTSAMTAIGKSIPTKNDHKISKYIDYPNMKELFLSLQPRKMPASHVIPKALSA